MQTNANFRIAKDKIQLANGEKRLAILIEEEKLLTGIAGVEITTAEKTTEFTKEQYEFELKLLEKLREQRKIRSELSGNVAGLLAADEKYFQARAALEKRYQSSGGPISNLDINITKLNAEKSGQARIEAEKFTNLELFKQDQKNTKRFK
jgi:hypothetical protein